MMNHFVTDIVDPTLVYLRSGHQQEATSPGCPTPPLPRPAHGTAIAASHIMPVDYSMYNLWHQQQQQQQQQPHQVPGSASHSLVLHHNSSNSNNASNAGINIITTTSSSSASLHHHHHQQQQQQHQQQQQQHNEHQHQQHLQQHHHQQQQQNDRDMPVSRLELRDTRLAALGGVLGEIGSKLNLPGVELGGSTKLCLPGGIMDPSGIRSGSSNVDVSTRLSAIGDLNSRIATIGYGDFNARVGALVAESGGQGGVSNGLGSLGGDDSTNVMAGGASGFEGPNHHHHQQEQQNGLHRASLSANDRLFYNDFFASKKTVLHSPSNGSDVSAAAAVAASAAAFDLMNNLIRHGAGPLSDSNPAPPKQEVVVDSYPTDPSTTSSTYHHQDHNQAKTSIAGSLLPGNGYLYGSSGSAGDSYGGYGKFTDSPTPRVKHDPYAPLDSSSDNTSSGLITNSLASFLPSNTTTSNNNSNSIIYDSSSNNNTPSTTPTNSGNSNNNNNNQPGSPGMTRQVIDNQEVFGCPHCHYQSRRKNYLKQHMRTHTGEGKVYCPVCSYSTVWRQRLKHHILNHTKEKKPRVFPTTPRNRSASVSGGTNSNGGDGGAVSAGEGPVGGVGIMDSINGSIDSHNLPGVDVGGGTEKKFECSFCTYRTANKNYLKQHTRTHTGDGSLRCPDCPYTTVWRQRMKRHILGHRGEKEASCTHCSYSTHDRDKLARHIEAHGDIVYTCDVCHFTTQRKTYMKQHARTHTGEGKVKCPHCPYQTVWKQRLKLHVRKHSTSAAGGAAPRGNVTRLECPHCDFKSCRKDRLRNHMRVHGGALFECSLCPYSSASEDLLRHHMQTHGGDQDRGSEEGIVAAAAAAAHARTMSFVTGRSTTQHPTNGGSNNISNNSILNLPFAGWQQQYQQQQGDDSNSRLQIQSSNNNNNNNSTNNLDSEMLDIKDVPLQYDGYGGDGAVGDEEDNDDDEEEEQLGLIRRIDELTANAGTVDDKGVDRSGSLVGMSDRGRDSMGVTATGCGDNCDGDRSVAVCVAKSQRGITSTTASSSGCGITTTSSSSSTRHVMYASPAEHGGGVQTAAVT